MVGSMKEFLENLVADPEVVAAIDGEVKRRVRGLQAEAAVKEAVAAAGGRNLKAIRALLDTQSVESAQDMAAAARAAVAAVRKDSPYLFGQGAVFAQNTGNLPLTQQELGAMSFAEYRRYRKGN